MMCIHHCSVIHNSLTVPNITYVLPHPPLLPHVSRACVVNPFSPVLLCDPMDCSPPVSSVRGILQARILEWVAVPLLQGMFLTQGSNSCLSHVSALAGGFFTTSTTYLNGISSMNFKMSVSFPHQIKTIFVL